MNIDWSKAPEWANAVVAASTGTLYFVEAFGVRSKRRAVSNSDDCSRAADMTIKSYSWKLIEERPKKQDAWDGEGLPPVGTVCEVLWNESRVEYLRTKVFGVNEHGQPIHRFDEGPKKYQYQADVLRTASGTQVFRPIRTAEQLAEEEKIATIAEMRAVVIAASDRKRATIAECTATVALYEAGYRKQ